MSIADLTPSVLRLNGISINSKQIIVCLVILVHGLSLKGQTQINKEYRFNSYLNGRAEYEVKIVKTDTLKDGAFLLSASDSDGEGKFSEFSLQGNYINNLKAGKWIFTETELTSTTERFIKSFEIVSKATGATAQITANFETNKVNGNWNIEKRIIRESEVLPSYINADFNFKENRLNDRFNIKFNNWNISGQVDNNGFVDGTWQFKLIDASAQSYIEFYNFASGELRNHYVLFDNHKIDFDYSGLNMNDSQNSKSLVETDFNETFFEVLKLYKYQESNKQISLNNQEENHQSSLFILQEVFEMVNNYHNKLNETNTTSKLSFGAVKLQRYTFNNIQKELLSICNNLNNKIKAKIKTLQSNSQIEIERFNNKTLDEYFNLITIYNNQTKNYNEIIDIINNEAFAYVDKAKPLSAIFQEVNFNKSFYLNLGVEKELYDKNLPDNLNLESFSLVKIKNHLTDALENLYNIEKEVDLILEQNKKQTNLYKIEREIIENKAQIDSLYNVTNNKTHTYISQVSSYVTSFATKEFENYAASEASVKDEVASGINSCFINLIQLHEELGYQPTKDERLEEAFSRVILNPYTMTDMTERLKPRIYNAYYQHILPYLLENITQNLDCISLKAKVESFDKVFQKMLELRDEDTKEIERLLRRQDDVSQILNILDLTIIE